MVFCGENVRVEFILFTGASFTGTDKHILSIIMMALLHSPRCTELTPSLSHSLSQGFLHITHFFTVCVAFSFLPIDICTIISSNHLSSVRSPLNSLEFSLAFIKQINMYDSATLTLAAHGSNYVIPNCLCNLEYLRQKVLERHVDGQWLALEQKELKGAKLLQKGVSPWERRQMYQSKGYINVFMSVCLG